MKNKNAEPLNWNDAVVDQSSPSTSSSQATDWQWKSPQTRKKKREKKNQLDHKDELKLQIISDKQQREETAWLPTAAKRLK